MNFNPYLWIHDGARFLRVDFWQLLCWYYLKKGKKSLVPFLFYLFLNSPNPITIWFVPQLLGVLQLTRIVSWVGTWPGPPPVFSGLKSDVRLHKKLGLRMYPQRPLGRKRPWFRSICSPAVWKFRATTEHQQESVISNNVLQHYNQWLTISQLQQCVKAPAICRIMSQYIFVLLAYKLFSNKLPEFASIWTACQLWLVWSIPTHLAAAVPHFLWIIVGWLEALARGVDPAQLRAVVSYKELPCKWKDKKKPHAVIH